jgi:hypothetical protein
VHATPFGVAVKVIDCVLKALAVLAVVAVKNAAVLFRASDPAPRPIRPSASRRESFPRKKFPIMIRPPL